MSDKRSSSKDLALDLVGSAAHELRGPLGVIRATTYLLKRLARDGDSKSAHYLAQIDREVERGNRILTELMEDLRDPEPRILDCGLEEVLDRALRRVPVEGAIQLERAFAEPDMAAMADPGHLERILAALLRKALRAMPDGGRLLITGHQQGHRVVVEFSDTSAGMDADERQRVFQVPDTGGARNVELGLVLAERRARRHGGALECESTPGEGTTFRLTLPARIEP